MYDGSIVIGTELSTNKFDKQIADLDRKIDKEEDKKIIIEAKLSNQEQELERARQKADELADAYQKIKAVQEKVNQHKASPADFETMQNLQAQYGTLEKIDDVFQKAISKQDELQLKVQETKNKYEAINNEISQYKQKIEGINIQKQKAEVDQLKGSIDKVGNSFSGAVKKAGKLALAIFGIRSAYMLLRRASSELATYDEQYATNLEYIRFVLTQAIAPVLRYIVNLAMQLLGWINAILQAWFGVNLFANGSVEAFQKMKKGASGVSKAVKEIKKQLLGFDEINMLTSQSDTGTSAGAGGVTMPSIDLSSWQGDLPKWLDELIKNKDIILPLLTGIATALLLIKFGLSGIKALGIGIMVAGIVMSIQSLLQYMKDPTWTNFGNIIKGIGIALLGLALVIGSIPVAVAGAVALILGIIVSNWEKIKEKLEKGIGWLKSKIDWVKENMGLFWKTIYEQIINIAEFLVKTWDNVFTTWKKILDGVIEFFKGVFTGNWKQAWEGLKKIGIAVFDALKQHFINIWHFLLNVFKNIGENASEIFWGIVGTVKAVINGIISGINTLINGINNIHIEIPNWSPVNPGAKLGFSIPQIPYLKTGAIVNMPNKGTMINGVARGGESRKGRCFSIDGSTGHE